MTPSITSPGDEQTIVDAMTDRADLHIEDTHRLVSGR